MGQPTNPEAIKALREARRLPIAEIVRRTGLARRTIYRLESEVITRPAHRTLTQLAEVYGVEIAALLQQEGKE